MGAYDRWRLPELLTMVEHDTDASATAHLKAWEQKHHLLVTQKQRLQSLLADLTANWNPDKSIAAHTFAIQITDQISVLDAASRSAAQIWSGLGHITSAIADARRELQRLAAQYHDGAVATREFNRQAFPVLPDVLNAGSPIVPIPGLEALIMRQHQDRLNRQARLVMEAMDDRVQEASRMIATVPKVRPFDTGIQYEPGRGQVRTTGDGRLPVGTIGGQPVPAPTFSPPAWSVPEAVNPPPADGEAPILAGTPTPTVMPSSRWPSTGASGGITALPPGGVIGDVPSLPATADIATPVNGVIGGTSPRNSLLGGLPVSGSGGVSRTSGVSPRRWSTPTTADVSTVAGHSMRTGGSHDPSFERYVERRRQRRPSDPDDPWTVEEGVSPVLETPRPPIDHSPGPGVIGIDR
ncbi:hypothetical protein KZZ52_05260 [Dactylosporangium sp. AC04546]|uniref:hypothetical protein n=1 Tax=Dactylosporangium sp. AC04546 TaxID=2862460 RepID=UPI001EE06407|nr:hypothetical protein [Dactylosporangium sp. AC04546]WVK84822.1 hypothetical protein KZZ52_05260 [Dactylosporangium sp. AC04546]